MHQCVVAVAVAEVRERLRDAATDSIHLWPNSYFSDAILLLPLLRRERVREQGAERAKEAGHRALLRDWRGPLDGGGFLNLSNVFFALQIPAFQNRQRFALYSLESIDRSVALICGRSKFKK